jgi:hypothetical protein
MKSPGPSKEKKNKKQTNKQKSNCLFDQPKCREEIRLTKRSKLWALSSMLMRMYSGPAPKCFPLRVSTFMLLKKPSQSSMLSSSHLSHANAATKQISKSRTIPCYFGFFLFLLHLMLIISSMKWCKKKLKSTAVDLFCIPG